MEGEREKHLIRPWKEIAVEMSEEKSSKRIPELSLELEEAFRAQGTLPPRLSKKGA
jgi:hypothetical protein